MQKFNNRNKVLSNLSKLLKLFLDRSLVGPSIQAQTPWVKWVYNLMGGGTYNSPYLGRLRIPNYPISKTFTNELLATILSRRVERANKFLQYQFHRLERARENGNATLYWAIVLGLIRRSTAFHVCFLNRVVKGWYFRKSFEWAVKQKHEVHEKSATLPVDDFPLSNQSNLTRTYIVKPNGKLRPIGAPSIPDRIYQSSLAYFVTHWAEPRRVMTTQHGFRPGRGIWSAWFHILTNLLWQDTLLEYDLKSWFNRVPLFKDIAKGLELNYSLEDALIHFEIPSFMRLRLLRLMQSTPTKLPKNEFDPLDAEAYWMLPVGKIDRGDQYSDEGAWIGKKLDDGTTFWARTFSPNTHGGSQGSPLSPVLSGLFLDYVNFDRRIGAIDAVHYADDGIFSLAGSGANWKWLLKSLQNELGSTKLAEVYGRFKDLRLNRRKNRIYQTYIGLIHIARNRVYSEKPFLRDLSNIKRANLLRKFTNLTVANNIRVGTYARVIPAVEFPMEKCRLLKSGGKWLVDSFTFLGSVYDVKAETLNGWKLQEINLKNLWKIVGRTYNVAYPEAWSWNISPNSILWRLLCSNTILGKMKFVEPMVSPTLNKLVDPNLLLTREEKQMITQMSSLSCGLLLIAHRRTHRNKPLSLICEEPQLLTQGKH